MDLELEIFGVLAVAISESHAMNDALAKKKIGVKVRWMNASESGRAKRRDGAWY